LFTSVYFVQYNTNWCKPVRPKLPGRVKTQGLKRGSGIRGSEKSKQDWKLENVGAENTGSEKRGTGMCYAFLLIFTVHGNVLVNSSTVHVTTLMWCNQRWSPRGRGLDLEAPRGWQLSALALALKLKSLVLALASEPKSLVLASAFSLAYLIKEQGIKRTVIDSVQRNNWLHEVAELTGNTLGSCRWLVFYFPFPDNVM